MEAARPAKLVDPVCGMTVDVDAAEAAGLLLEYEGRTFAFCRSGCRRAFVEEPAMYTANAEAADASAAAAGAGAGAGAAHGGAWKVPASAPGPGESGFVAGTPAAPRVVRIAATPQLRFQPDVVTIQAGETITFEVTTMGPTVHEFMVGPAADVAADTAGTPEVADIGMMQTGSVTYTFTGAGPFAFACHAPGHYEAGMTGTITIT